MNWTYVFYFITFPLIGALLGWFTNYLAVKMLFHPKLPQTYFRFRVGKWNIKGITIQGIFPKRQKQMAMKIGKVVSNELLSFHDIKEKVITEDSFEGVYKHIENRMNQLIEVDLPKKYPLLSMLTRKKLKQDLRDQVMKEVKLQVPELVDKQLHKIEEKINIEQMIADKFSELSSDRLEQVLKQILDKEFKFIEQLGGVIGFLVGLVQAFLAVMIG